MKEKNYKDIKMNRGGLQQIMYIYPGKSSFVQNDIHLLEKNYFVKTKDLDWKTPFKLPYNLLAQLFFILRNSKDTRAIIVSFAGYFSLLPAFLGKIFKIPTFVILNGTECVSFPNYNYGSLRKPLLRFFVKKSLRYATKLLPVDESLIYQTHTFDKNVSYKKQGFRAFFPKIKTPVSVIPNGFDLDFWHFNPKIIRQKSFITVVSGCSKDTLKVKGIDLILEIAGYFPTHKFTIIGICERLKKELVFPDNVIIGSFVSQKELKNHFNKNQFYLQLSINEGFGCSLAEAMLCGCTPIVSNVGALPNVIGQTGFLVTNRDVESVKNQLEKALGLEPTAFAVFSQKARLRIIDNFAIDRRESLLLQEIQNY